MIVSTDLDLRQKRDVVRINVYIYKYLRYTAKTAHKTKLNGRIVYSISLAMFQINELYRRQHPETYHLRPEVEKEVLVELEALYEYARAISVEENPHHPDIASLLDEILFDVTESWSKVGDAAVLSDYLENPWES